MLKWLPLKFQDLFRITPMVIKVSPLISFSWRNSFALVIFSPLKTCQIIFTSSRTATGTVQSLDTCTCPDPAHCWAGCPQVRSILWANFPVLIDAAPPWEPSSRHLQRSPCACGPCQLFQGRCWRPSQSTTTAGLELPLRVAKRDEVTYLLPLMAVSLPLLQLWLYSLHGATVTAVSWH